MGTAVRRWPGHHPVHKNTCRLAAAELKETAATGLYCAHTPAPTSVATACLAGKDAVAEFKAERIPGAQFFDLDGVCDKSTGMWWSCMCIGVDEQEAWG